MRITHAGIGRLAAWIGQELAAHTLGERAKPVNAFSLSHVEAGINEREVRTIKIGSTIDPMVIARAFYEAATSYASELASGSGRQQFVIYAHIEGLGDDELPHHPLSVQGETNIGLTGTEPATKDGFMSQMMRHNEGIIQMAFAAIGKVNEQLLQQNANMMANVDKLTTKHFETLQLAETVVMTAAEGEHKKQIELMALQQSGDMKNRLLTMAPALASMVGIDIPSAMVDTSILETITNELSADDLEQFLALMRMKLKPDAMAVMQDRMGKIIDEKRKSEAIAVANGNVKDGAH